MYAKAELFEALRFDRRLGELQEVLQVRCSGKCSSTVSGYRLYKEKCVLHLLGPTSKATVFPGLQRLMR